MLNACLASTCKHVNDKSHFRVTYIEFTLALLFYWLKFKIPSWFFQTFSCTHAPQSSCVASQRKSWRSRVIKDPRTELIQKMNEIILSHRVGVGEHNRKKASEVAWHWRMHELSKSLSDFQFALLFCMVSIGISRVHLRKIGSLPPPISITFR
jgi:hypothetical protein